jgi:ketosteroid isomerase-like protein
MTGATLTMDEAWRPFLEAVVTQLMRFRDDYVDLRFLLADWQRLAAANDLEGLVAALLDDVTLLSAAYQHADLLPVATDASAAVMATAIAEATHRLT